MTKRPRFKSGFTLGGEQAEADPLLQDAFYESSDYDVIRSKKDPRCFLVGRTGAGKSAALQRLEEDFQDHVIRINPEDLSLPYITDLQVIRHLDSLDVNLDLFWIALWKHVLLVEVIRHRYNVSSPEAKSTFMQGLRDRLSRDAAKKAALEYFDEFEGKFWAEADERVREITDRFARQIDAGSKVQFPGAVDVGAGLRSTVATETRREESDRYQRIVNDTQLAKLNRMISILNEDILDPKNFTYVVIDDLDRDWVDERLANDLIRCLFRTVLDLKRVLNLKVLVALRTNIFHELDFGKKGGGQEEKFRSLVLNVRWTRADLEDLLDERVRAAADQSGLTAMSVADLLPHPNKTRGNPLDYILDRTLLRPRDAIAYMNECLAVGIGKSRLSWEEIHAAEAAYSTNRLLALRDEWKTTFPGIDKVLELFRGAPARMPKDEYRSRLDNVFLLTADGDFDGTVWLTNYSEAAWSTESSSPSDIYRPLTKLLYDVGLIGCSLGARRAPAFHLDQPLLMDTDDNFDRCEAFFIHRTYQAALGVRFGERQDEPDASAARQEDGN